MKAIEYMETHGHEQLLVCLEPSVGMKAFIAIHDTTLGPGCGGLRIWPHASDDDAVMDVLRLSRAMTYKSAVAGLNFGGGKALILADSRTDKSEAMLRAFGRHVDSLGGRYIATEDVGMTPPRSGIRRPGIFSRRGPSRVPRRQWRYLGHDWTGRLPWHESRRKVDMGRRRSIRTDGSVPGIRKCGQPYCGASRVRRSKDRRDRHRRSRPQTSRGDGRDRRAARRDIRRRMRHILSLRPRRSAEPRYHPPTHGVGSSQAAQTTSSEPTQTANSSKNAPSPMPLTSSSTPAG